MHKKRIALLMAATMVLTSVSPMGRLSENLK